ncbi:MAG: LacI family DNA-binding transcriptional regulator [Acutalibacteraceae bacterium]|nr:LacI family DNA-binding transcriptional regulator [Acutalibacteraceae bacterium]
MLKKEIISTKKIAQICGVSQGTVDRALNNRTGISAKTKEKVLKTAAEYGYKRNIHASAMAGGKSMLIGVVVFDLQNTYFTDFIMNLQTECALLGYSLVTMFTDKDPQREKDCIRDLYYMSVDGMVICPVDKGDDFSAYLLSLGFPVVTVGNRLDKIPYVGIDNFSAMQDTVKYVLQSNCSHILYVMPDITKSLNFFAQGERRRGFEAAAKEAGVDYTVTNVCNAEKYLSLKENSIVVCATDWHALRLYDTARKHSVGIIGFDNIGLLDMLQIPLDSVSYDIKKTSELVLEFIISGKQLENSVPYHIVSRGSV